MNPTLYPDSAEARAHRASFYRSMKLNAWLAVATGTYLVTLLALRQNPDWSAGWKVALTLSPVLPGLLYAWSGLRLLRELDELQRRIQLEALLFAAIGTVVVLTVFNVLQAHGLGWARYPHGLGIGGTYLTMFILWCIGFTAANLRFR